MSYARHWLRKLGRTTCVLFQLGCARMLGRYIHSGWDGSMEYTRYYWRGRDWIIPTGPVVDKEEL